MNQDIFLNIQTFLKLLKTAKGEAVSQWNEAALRRAIKWAEYVEQLYSKVCHNPEALDKLTRAVKRMHKVSGDELGKQEISAEDLKGSRKLLIKILLENGHLSSQLYHMILPTASIEKNQKNQDDLIGADDFVQFTGQCASLKSTCNILTQIDACLEGYSTSDSDILIDANMLRGHLLMSWTNTKNILESKKKNCDSLLHSVAAKPGGLEVIGCTIGLDVPDKTAAPTADVLDNIDQFVFDWLMKNKDQYIPNT